MYIITYTERTISNQNFTDTIHFSYCGEDAATAIAAFDSHTAKATTFNTLAGTGVHEVTKKHIKNCSVVSYTIFRATGINL